MRCRWPLLLPLALAACAAPRPSANPGSARAQAVRFVVDSVATGTTARLIGLDAAPGGVVWTAGTGGAWARSLDGGRSWTTGTVPSADTLQFRDVHAFDARRAVLLSIGQGTASRVYTTDDGGASWAMRWTNPDPRAFYDCMAFEGNTGYAFSDAVTDASVSAAQDTVAHLPMVETSDGGRSWRAIPAERTPAVPPGTGAFASSGTCAVLTRGTLLMATSRGDAASTTARIVVWRGGVQHQSAVPVSGAYPNEGVAALAVQGDSLFAGLLGPASGVAAWRAPLSDVVEGRGQPATLGDLARTLVPRWSPQQVGLKNVYGLAASPRALVATGPDGLAASSDGGQTWQVLTRADLWSAVRVDDGTFVAVGRGGRAVRITVR